MKVKGSSNTPKKGGGRRTSRSNSFSYHSSSGEVETSLVGPPPPPAAVHHRPVDSSSASAVLQDDLENIARGGVATPFPWKLHEMLEDSAKEGNESIVGWQPHGHSFLVHKPKEFVEKIMPTYFNQSKFASFQRQLNLYGFHRLSHGKDKGAYYHNCFIRNQVHLCRLMVRQKVKGTKVRRTSEAGVEPDFYTMTNVVPIDEVPPSPGQLNNKQLVQPPPISKTTTTTKKKTNKKGTTTKKTSAAKSTGSKKSRKQDRRPSNLVLENLLVVEETPTRNEDEEEIMKGFPPLPGQSSIINMPELPLLPPIGQDQEQEQQQTTTIMMNVANAVPALLPTPPLSPPSPPPLEQRKADVISAKERAHRLRQEREQQERERQEREQRERQERERQERLNAVRNALKETEKMLFGDGDDDDAGSFGSRGNKNHHHHHATTTGSRRGSSVTSSSSSLPTISIKPMIPSVSPLESEVSDFEDDSSVFPPLRFHHHHHHTKEGGRNPSFTTTTTNMPSLVANPPPLIPATLEPLAFHRSEPLVPRFTTTHSRETMKMAAAAEGIIDTKAGDVLFFEGKPFRYLEHLDSLPPPPPSISSSSASSSASSSMVAGGGGRPVVASSVPAAEMQKPKTWNTTAHPNFGGNAAGGFQRDSLQSLMRVDPQAIFNFNIRTMP